MEDKKQVAVIAGYEEHFQVVKDMLQRENSDCQFTYIGKEVMVYSKFRWDMLISYAPMFWTDEKHRFRDLLINRQYKPPILLGIASIREPFKLDFTEQKDI